MINTVWRTIVIGVCVVAGGRPVFAQQEVAPPFRQLFASAVPPIPRHHRLYFAGSVYVGRAETTVERPADAAYRRLYTAGGFAATPTLQYVFTGERVVLRSVTGATLQSYAPLGFFARRYFESVRLHSPLTEHTDLTIRGVATYSPVYVFDLAVDPEQTETDLVPAGDQQIVVFRRNLDIDTNGEWRYRLRQRSELDLDGGFAHTGFFDSGLDVSSPHAGVRFGHQVTANARLQLGYAYRRWIYDGGSDAAAAVPSVRLHDIRAGFKYSRPLPFWSRSRAGFSLGSGVSQTPGRTRFDFTGEAFLLHQISRSWNAAATYRRGLEVRSGLSQPLFLFGDSVALTAGGLLARRVALRTAASYFRGRSLLDRAESRLSWWSGTSVLSVRVAGPLAAFGQGAFVSQRVSARLGNLVGLPTFIDRYALSAGLTVAFPLVR